MVKFRFVQPVGTKEKAKGLIVPRTSLTSVTVTPYKEKYEGAEVCRVMVRHLDEANPSRIGEVKGVMFVADMKRVEGLLVDRLPGPVASEAHQEALNEEAVAHIEAHRHHIAADKRRAASGFMDWLSATGREVVSYDEAGDQIVHLSDDLANEYAQDGLA